MLNENALENYLDFVYRTNESLLDKAHYSRLDLTHTDSILLEIETGGSKGGDNWSAQADNYYINNDTKALNISEQLYCHYLKQFLGDKYPQERVSHLCQSYGYSYYQNIITAYSQEYDYYGNGKQFDIIEIPLLDFFSELLDDDDFEDARVIYGKMCKKESLRIKEKNALKELKTLQHQLQTFEEEKQKELADLKHDHKNYQQTILFLEKRIEAFDNIKSNEYEKLMLRKKQLETLGFHVS